MNIADTLTTIAQNQQKVYDAGRDAERLRLYNAMTNYGARKDYQHAFRYADYSDVEFIKPVMVGQGSKQASAAYIFRYYNGNRLPRNINLSKISTTATHGEMFHYAQKLEEIEDIGIPTLDSYQNAFKDCTNLKKIHKMRVHETTTFYQTFTGCESLEEVWFDGTIGKNISFEDCPNLTFDCVNDIFNHLKDFGSTEPKCTITFHEHAYRDKVLGMPEVVEGAEAQGWAIKYIKMEEEI